MKILVIESSPHMNGSSNHLANEFMRGAQKNGSEISVYDAAHPGIRPCLGCGVCRMAGKCVQPDGMEALKDKIRAADMLVFVTPLYYFNVSSQLKSVIDRFYSFNQELVSMHKKSVFICASWNDDDWCMNVVENYYHTLCRYLGFRNMGTIFGTGCGNVFSTRHSPYMKQAYHLGEEVTNELQKRVL